MDFLRWLLGLLFGKVPGRVTNVQIRVIHMQEIDVSWSVPTTRKDGSAMPVSEIAYTEASISTDGGKTFSTPVQVKPDATQIIKRTPATDGAYVFRLVVVGVNGKKGDAVDTPVTVDTPAPGTATGISVKVL